MATINRGVELEKGSRVSVYWSEDEEYYEATIKKAKRRKCGGFKYWIQYDDGDSEWMDTSETEFIDGSKDTGNPYVSNLSVGSRVSVWWHLEKKYFLASVSQLDPSRAKPHFLKYDDGDTEWTNLQYRTFCSVGSATAATRDGSSENGNDSGGNESEDDLETTAPATSVSPKRRKIRKKRTWEEHFQELEEYYAIHGHSNVKTNHPSLGAWIGMQQSAVGRKKLSHAQRDLLSSVDFDWRTAKEKFDQRWELMFQLYKKYRLGHPGSTADLGYFRDAEKTLLNWVSQQQTNGNNGTLRQDRRDILENVGFLWIRNESVAGSNNGQFGRKDRWNSSFKKLEEYKAKKGHTFVQPEDDIVLWRWVHKQKLYYRKDTLKKERIEQMESIGLVWDVDCFDEQKGLEQRTWSAHFSKLSEYFKKHGHSNVKRSQDERLHHWLSIQRQNYKNGKQHQARMEKLDKLNFVPNTRIDRWDEMFSQLVAYKAEHGKWPTTGAKTELSNFVRRVREENTRGIIWPDRKRKLLDIGFCFDHHNEQWHRMFARTKRCHESHGSGDVPLWKYKEAGLEAFVRRQRKNGSKSGGRQAEREKLLDSIDFVWAGPRGSKPRGATK